MNSIEKTIFRDPDSPVLKIDTKTLEIPVASTVEFYILNCGSALSRLSSSLDKAKMTIECLESSTDLIPDGTLYTTDEFIELAIENYIIRSSTIYDRCLIFTNKLLNLGIADESINHDLIVTNEHVKEYNLNGALKKIRKICMKHRVQRNRIVHHDRYKDEEFFNLSTLYIANWQSEEDGRKPPIDQATIVEMTARHIHFKATEFAEHLV